MLKRKSIFLLPFLVFVGWVTSCTKPSPEVAPTQHTAHISISLDALRSAHGVDTENPGATDPNLNPPTNPNPEDQEDVITELRLILFRPGAPNASFNMKFDAANIQNNRVTFKMSELAAYDMYLLANESASGQATAELAFLSLAGVSRNLLENNIANVKMVGIAPEQMGSGVRGRFMMTAVYKGVNFSRSLPGSGTQSDPHRIDLEVLNRAQRPDILGNRKPAEMMRSLAKMEITLTDIVEVVINEDGSKTYSWILPYGYEPDTRLKVELLNMPKAYTLFPRKQLTDPGLIGTINDYVFSFQQAPEKSHIVLPANIDEASIGGILTADYKLYVYLPEYLAPQTLEKEQRPGVKITYRARNKITNVWEEQYQYYPIQNGNGNKKTHYDTVLGDLKHSKEWSVFRNRLYQMKVKVKGTSPEF